VYEIHNWHPGDTTPYATRTFTAPAAKSRWEFTGAVASRGVRDKYVGKSVAQYFPQGAQSPVVYVNID
jgi:hypothetical protein